MFGKRARHAQQFRFLAGAAERPKHI
ncbi:hypothetical protein CGRA01v4_07612 [Colletotrichum graminicola]|nr:hypothetical protein CGRA01v4_07612 [Colletotrichum graminicola]